MSNSRRLVLAGIVGLILAVVVAAVTFPLWRPLFVDDVVDEAFPGLDPALQDDFTALPAEAQDMFVEMIEVDAEMAVAMAEAAVSPDETAPTDEGAMPAGTDPVSLAVGSFIELDPVHGAGGTATIYQLEGDQRVLRFENFQSTNGPALHVILTRHPDPRTRDEVGDDYVDLGMLKGNVGDQNYDIPADLDLAGYQSVVIYCVPFHVVFSTATLSGA